MDVVSRSNTRFEISNAGWRRMNAGRPAGHLIREAISNTFDQVDIKRVDVNISGNMTFIEDDSPTGISDPALITTVFLTDKEDDHRKRGRKGRGLKELISAAEWAQIDTVGHTIIFEEGRTQLKNTRTVGTKVTVRVPQWTEADTLAATDYLSRIVPPSGVTYTLNGVIIHRRKLRGSIVCKLETQIVDDGIQRSVEHETTVELFNLKKGEKFGWLHEMGIPIQQLTTRFDIDVQQRVPMNDNRDSVSDEYLNQLYGRVIDCMADSISRPALKDAWVANGIKNANRDTVRKIVKKLYGESRLAVETNNKAANDRAKQHGYKIINTAGLSYDVIDSFSRVVDSTITIAHRIDDSAVESAVNPNTIKGSAKFIAGVQKLAKLIINKDIKVEFFSKQAAFTGSTTLADWNRNARTIRFNVLGGFALDNPYDKRILATLCHEFAHEVSDYHGEEFYHEVERLSGEMAHALLDAIIEKLSQE